MKLFAAHDVPTSLVILDQLFQLKSDLTEFHADAGCVLEQVMAIPDTEQ